MNRKLATPKNNLLLAIAITFVLILLFLFWPGDLRQYPLGDKNKLEYIGYEAGGCPSIYFLGFCDSRPYKTLYYATDMTPEEVVGYFRGARHEEASWDSGGGSGVDRYSALHFSKDNKDITIYYYNNGQEVSSERGLRKTDKGKIISISDTAYEAAKSSL